MLSIFIFLLIPFSLFHHYERILNENFVPIPFDIHLSDKSFTKLTMIKFLIENVPFVFQSHSFSSKIDSTSKHKKPYIVLMTSLDE
jgi:hypothetical protein